MSTREWDPALLAFAARLFELARQGRAGPLCAYLDEGAPVNLTNDKGDSLLMLAACHGHAALVAALLERGADTDPVNDRGLTALAGAVAGGATEVVRVLLAAGADPDAGTPSARETARALGYENLMG